MRPHPPKPATQLPDAPYHMPAWSQATLCHTPPLFTQQPSIHFPIARPEQQAHVCTVAILAVQQERSDFAVTVEVEAEFPERVVQ